MQNSFILMLFFGLSVSLSAQNIKQKIKDIPVASSECFFVSLEDKSANHISIPISIIKGNEKGSTLTVVAGIHGFEYPPIIAVSEILNEINPTHLKGTIILLPMANPAAFYGRTPFINPQDDLNLNRSFPGKKDGSITEQIAHFITTNIIPESDVFLDVHGGDANEDLMPFVCYYNNLENLQQTQKAKQLSEASGFQTIVSYPYNLTATQPSLYAFKQAVQNGKIALSFEAGKLGNVQDEAVDMIKKGIYNILAHMDMYGEKSNTIPKKEKLRLNQQTYIKATQQGFLISSFKAGDLVQKGEKIGEIRDVFGKILSTITASQSGKILYKIGTPPINKGETVFCIGYTDSQE